MELIDDYITTKYNVFLSELKLKGKTSGVFGATISDEALKALAAASDTTIVVSDEALKALAAASDTTKKEARSASRKAANEAARKAAMEE